MPYVEKRRRKVVMVRGVEGGVEAGNKKRRDRLWGEIKEEGKNKQEEGKKS
jgi:hypothetical protein